MTVWKQPPKAKVYEALSAVADGRVTMIGAGAAKVLSSSRDKVYTVRWSENGASVTSEVDRIMAQVEQLHLTRWKAKT